jgi:DNA-binding NtrC family response regulator
MESRRLDIRHTFDTLIASSTAMRQVLAVARRLAADNRPAFLDGEVGTGRKFMARVLHQEGARCSHPFAALRCGTLTVNVFDRTLFGDDRTGTIGKFEEAAEGTLLLTDLEELNPVAQEKLIKVLDAGRYVTADCESRYITARLLSTGNRDRIEKQIQAGQFNERLFAKLSETSLRMPLLADRLPDIPDLVMTVLRDLSERERIEMPAVPYHYLELLMGVPWPENVRQLRNHIESVMVLSGGQFDPEIIREHFVPEGSPATIKGALQGLLNKLRGAADPETALAANRGK